MSGPSSFSNVRQSWWLLTGILLIAANLRAPMTCLAPVLGQVRDAFALDTAQAGLLTTLPILMIALMSAWIPALARIRGIEWSLLLAMGLLIVGVGLRSLAGLTGLYVGTAVIGMGIAIGNVLLPSLLKKQFPTQVASLTGVYFLVMGVAAGAGSAMLVPIADASDWRVALAALGLGPLVAFVCWWPQARRARGEPPAALLAVAAPDADVKVWRSALAWQVAIFMVCTSTIYYVVIAWLPDILVAAGYSRAQAGSLHGLMQLSTALPGLVFGLIIKRLKDQRLLAATIASLLMISLTGYLVMPQWALVWSVVFGAASGASAILGYLFMSLRARTPLQAARLAGMAQGIGSLCAAAGPLLAGALHDGFGGWHLPILACVLLSAVMFAAGLKAGRAIYLSA